MPRVTLSTSADSSSVAITSMRSVGSAVASRWVRLGSSAAAPAWSVFCAGGGAICDGERGRPDRQSRRARRVRRQGWWGASCRQNPRSHEYVQAARKARMTLRSSEVFDHSVRQRRATKLRSTSHPVESRVGDVPLHLRVSPSSCKARSVRRPRIVRTDRVIVASRATTSA